MPTYIGYHNPKSMPITSMINGRHFSVPPNTAVLRSDGTLVAKSAECDTLADQGILSRIPANHPKWKDHDSKITQRKQGLEQSMANSLDKTPKAVPAKKQGRQPAVHVTGKGIEDIPDGAEFQSDGTISFDGKSYPSIGALKAFIAQQTK